MDNWLGWGILIVVLVWAGKSIYEGYRRETAPPLPLMDNGHGLMEPVCPTCKARLVTVQHKDGGGLATVISAAVILAGVVVLVGVNWLAGLVMILLGVVIHHAGKSTRTVLTCPVCRAEVRELD